MVHRLGTQRMSCQSNHACFGSSPRVQMTLVFSTVVPRESKHVGTSDDNAGDSALSGDIRHCTLGQYGLRHYVAVWRAGGRARSVHPLTEKKKAAWWSDEFTHVPSGPKSSRKLPMNSRDFSSHFCMRSWLLSSTRYTKCLLFSSTVRTFSFMRSTWFCSRYFFSWGRGGDNGVTLFISVHLNMCFKLLIHIFNAEVLLFPNHNGLFVSSLLLWKWGLFTVKLFVTTFQTQRLYLKGFHFCVSKHWIDCFSYQRVTKSKLTTHLFNLAYSLWLVTALHLVSNNSNFK